MQDGLLLASLAECHHATVEEVSRCRTCMSYDAYVLNHMTMIADEQECAAVRQIDLHACAARVKY